MNSHPSLTHLGELISSDDSLRIHELSFDARFALGLAEHLARPGEANVERARMALRLEQAGGRPALVALLARQPTRLPNA